MSKKRSWLRGLLIGLLIFLVAGLATGTLFYTWIKAPSLVNTNQDTTYFYIPTGSQYDQVYLDFKELGLLRYERGFDWVARQKEYPQLVKPGRYLLTRGMSNIEIVDLLRSGRQAEVTVVFNTTRHLERIAGIVAANLEADSLSLIQAFRDTTLMEKYGFQPDNWFAFFVPNTYRFLWNTNALGFMDRMHREYQVFWNDKRKDRLKELGMSNIQIVTLASIVQEETFKTDEMPRVAGVYMNRLKRGMKLQADPTVIFALQDFTIRRVLHRHLRVDSPYNTYRYSGLPPGPIRIPSIQAVDACLNYERHNFIYFCAREDFSGYHAFAETYRAHLANARRYQRALNNRENPTDRSE
ncbi:MAG: endolytic transglycosylase MltG [Bacteroidales bacterium]|nr:endolytic transglycosylase MltG [Bacteroidales bacterium]NLO68866.1 endolytic transglycosylase MltG [Bacteroidales bacterium]